jgi:polar amino acid transport system substrate-binding protein
MTIPECWDGDMNLRRLLLGLVLICVMTSPVVAQEDAPLRVATKLFPPFVMAQGDTFTGFSIQLWEAIAQETGLDYELYEVETVADQLNAVQTGEADAAVAGISITAEREAVIDFSFPFFDAGLQILTRVEDATTLTSAIPALLSAESLQFLLVVIALTLVAAHILWWFERRTQSDFGKGYRVGIGQALWWSAVTVVGFDDRPPSTLPGRLMALVWMFAGIFIIANLTATLSAGATVRELRSRINDIADLRDHRVVTVAGTTSAIYLATNGIGYRPVDHIDQAYELLLTGQADAVVYDAPVLRYFVNTEGAEVVQVVGQVFEPEKYGVALPANSPLRERINQAILRLQDD